MSNSLDGPAARPLFNPASEGLDLKRRLAAGLAVPPGGLAGQVLMQDAAGNLFWNWLCDCQPVVGTDGTLGDKIGITDSAAVSGTAIRVSCGQIFTFTKAVQQWVVPNDVTAVRFDIVASSGTTGGGVAGRGGRIRFWRQVTPGQVYNVYVGGNAGPDAQGDGGGWPNGGDAVRANNVGGFGGGASYVILASDDTLGAGVVTNAIGVAGAGGGGGRILSFPTAGGDGGFYQGTAAWAGGGATQSAPGLGITGTRPGEDGDTDGQGFGGDGYDAGGPSVIAEGGGGGGGWHGGGGGGGGNEAQGGGGGSGWSDPANYGLEIFDAYNEQGAPGWIQICTPCVGDCDDQILIWDNFDRADGSLGADWTVDGTFVISSNQVTNTGNDTAGAKHNTSLGSTDHYVELDIDAASTAPPVAPLYHALRVRINGSEQYLGGWYAGGGGSFFIARGTTAVILTSLTAAYPAGSRWRFEVQGPALRFYVDDALTLSTTDSTYTTGLQVGFAGYGASGNRMVFDNFEAGRVSSAMYP